eukprot:s832_g4.t1
MFAPLVPMLLALANLQTTAIADECVACQAESRSSGLLQRDTKLASLSTELPGLVMWSYGRSATGSFMKSLQKTTGLSFCNGEKESFFFEKTKQRLTSSALKTCMQRGQRLTHVKPYHLVTVDSDLRTPHDFFNAAYEAGYRIVVASFRENQLARDVSSYRNDYNWFNVSRASALAGGIDNWARRRLEMDQPNRSLIERYEDARKFYNLGVTAAKELGFTVVACNFADMVVDMCECVRLALKTLPDQNASKCNELEIHEGGASRNDTLESSIPATVAAEIRKSLLGTKYEWMLDLEAMDWPKDIEPEVPVPTWRQHRILN